jgi:hypothetical protein
MATGSVRLESRGALALLTIDAPRQPDEPTRVILSGS